MIIVGLYLLYLFLALMLVVATYRQLYLRGRLQASVASGMVLCAFALFFPIPIHGDLTFPLEMIWQELAQQSEACKEQRDEQGQQAFHQLLERRFRGVVDDYELVGNESVWHTVQLHNGEQVQLDSESGLLWHGPHVVPGSLQQMSIDEAEQFCQQLFPAGYWALPSEAEAALLWLHGGHRLMPATGHSAMLVRWDEALLLKMPTRFRGSRAGYALRCVALTQTVPRRGYLGSDLPLDLWNRYQLQKGELFQAQKAPAPIQEIK